MAETNDLRLFDRICAEIANSFEKEPHDRTDCQPCVDADAQQEALGLDHDPMCIPIYTSILWWSWLLCGEKLDCILLHAAVRVERDRLQLGHCDAEGGEWCKCFPISWPLSTIMLLLTIVTALFAGPLGGAVSGAVIRSIITRMAAAAAASA